MKAALFGLCIFGFYSVELAAQTLPRKVAIICESTQHFIRPYYRVKIDNGDGRNPNYFKVEIVRYDDLSGNRRTVIKREGPGRMSFDAFDIPLKKMDRGTLIDKGDHIRAAKLLNGVVRAELRMYTGEFAQLACR